MKIHILGGPGSGKTTLAKMLAARLQVPHHDLDRLGWSYGGQIAAYVDEAFAIAARPAWVTEGIYLVWVDPLLYRADAILLMEVSWAVAAWRILRRHVTLSLRRANPYPTRLLYPFLKDTRRYYLGRASTDPALSRALAQLLAGQAEDPGPPQREKLLQRLETANAGIPLTAEFTRCYLEKYQMAGADVTLHSAVHPLPAAAAGEGVRVPS